MSQLRSDWMKGSFLMVLNFLKKTTFCPSVHWLDASPNTSINAHKILKHHIRLLNSLTTLIVKKLVFGLFEQKPMILSQCAVVTCLTKTLVYMSRRC